MLHLITLGTELRERGIGLKVLEQGIDTATAEGRAMLGMLSVLAELQRELIVTNTRDGLAAARARGRKGGRPSKLSPDQIELAQRLYGADEHTVAQIASMLKVPRTTVYGHLNTRRTPVTQESAVVADPPVRTPRTCPSCGYEPTTRAEAAHQRTDLAVTWLHADPTTGGRSSADTTVGIANPDNRHSTSPAASAATDPSSPARSPSKRRTATSPSRFNDGSQQRNGQSPRISHARATPTPQTDPPG